MTIQLGGQQFTEDEVIAAIAASNDVAKTEPLEAVSIEDVRNILQAVLTRIQSLEDRAPITRSGYGVTTEVTSTHTKHTVQCLDAQGRVNLVTFETPLP